MTRCLTDLFCSLRPDQRREYDNQFNIIMEEKLIPAPIDEKNITSDWIEDIFDNCCFGGKKNNIYVGFIKNCVVLCEYNDNVINWKVESECFNKEEARKSAFNELRKRLKTIDKESFDLVVKYSPFDKDVTCLTQSFFFKDED